MDNNRLDGTWLLLDAAGPDMVFGLVRDGAWLEFVSSRKPFLEGCQKSVQPLLERNGTSLNDLNGAIYAAGPGSTLGLRLAAMYLRSLLAQPDLGNWQCLQYNNLAIAAASLPMNEPRQVIAPWRKDCLHKISMPSENPLEWILEAAHPDELGKGPVHLFPLGTRATQIPDNCTIEDIPVQAIPSLIEKFPALLRSVELPTPYSAEKTDFARWTPERHRAR